MRERFQKLHPQDDDHTEQLVLHAMSLDNCGQSQAAWDIVSRLITEGNRLSSLLVLHARMAPRYGRDAEALGFVLDALKDPRDLTVSHRSSLHFCAASLLDDMGQYDQAFEHARQAHELLKAPYDSARIERLLRDWTSYFTPARLRRLPRATHSSQVPVFVVGMPRTGSTLVEQILCSHPQVHGAGELNWVFGLWTSAVRRVSRPEGSLIECLDRLTASEVNELAAEYLQPLFALAPKAQRIIDKLPMNVLNLGLIALLFPEARVIHTIRHPLDTCVSCYMTDLAAGNDFGFDLASTAHLYRHCRQLMSHWHGVLEVPILDVRYECVVEDVESEARRMIQFLDLPWDPACLRFYENHRPVATASSTQVHLPIYRRSVGRWRHYERHLHQLRAAIPSHFVEADGST